MITIYFAPPGVGKSSLCARFAFWEHVKSKLHMQTYDRVMCNFPVKYTYQFTKDDIGSYDLSWDVESNSRKSTLVLYDEASTDFHARFYKAMSISQIEHFKKHRKYNEDIAVFSQSFDVDKVIRELAPRLYYLKPCTFLPYHIKALRISKFMNVDNEQHDMCDGFKLDPWFLRIFTTRRYYLPFYWGMFDSWDPPELKHKEFDRIE